jgi:hypothetical protein
VALHLFESLEGGTIRVYADLDASVPPVAVAFELHVDAGVPGAVTVIASWKRPNGQLDTGERTIDLTGAAVQERQAFPGPFQHPADEYSWTVSYDPRL